VNKPWTRRDVLKILSAAPMLGAAPLANLLACRTPQFSAASPRTRSDAQTAVPKLLLVVGAMGGGSIVDSFLAVRASECGANAPTLNTFPDGAVSTIGAFRAVTQSGTKLGQIPLPYSSNQVAFVNAHKDDMLVATTLNTSVNHPIAQNRSVTGNDANKGRTLQEQVAAQFGAGLPLPAVNMAAGGFQEGGRDASLPTFAIGATVANPTLWHLGLSASRGVSDPLPEDLIQRARDLRDRSLDPEAIFTRTFSKSPRLQRWFAQRTQSVALEQANLLEKLNIVNDQFPTEAFGIATSPDAAKLQQAFPRHGSDPFEAQAALAFLLFKHGVSCAASISPSFNGLTIGSDIVNPPIAFDFSHNDHRATQAYMWSRILGVVDKLIALMKAEPYGGSSMWDHTLIYVATDFGRTRTRPPNATVFSSGHDLNNGVLMISPMVKGNTVLGGVDPATTLCYGFNAATGAPLPGDHETNEAKIYSGVLHAMGADTTGLPDASAFKA
jgi:hypothetical protein